VAVAVASAQQAEAEMHYKNGRQAKVGDAVVGRTFNTGNRAIAGTLVTLTPGPDACSAKVGFLETRTVSAMSAMHGAGLHVVSVQGTEQHGNAGELEVIFYREDYTECKNLLHADDAFSAHDRLRGTSGEIARAVG
jgi:hypothetical protein